MSESNFSDDIAIIAQACILPGAMEPRQFWQNILKGYCTFAPISEARMKHHLLKTSETSQLKSQSLLASEIPLAQLSSSSQTTDQPIRRVHRLTLYFEAALKQLMAQLDGTRCGERQDIILGCMNPDVLFELQIAKECQESHLQDLEQCLTGLTERTLLHDWMERAVFYATRHHEGSKDHFYTTALLAKAAKAYQLNGEQLIIDSACASSLAAIDIAIQRLKTFKADLAIVGGFESNLGQASYFVFSAVGALAPEVSCPFSKKSQGIVQSEGSVLFAIKRLEDALRDGNPILGIVKAVAGGSDGRQASLFQPSEAGQERVYAQVYSKNKKLDYLEAHGTGTEIGDMTESASINNFFKGQNLPFGSVKTLIGHSKGAAGATGVLKALGIIQHRTVPPSHAQGELVFKPDSPGPFLNTEVLPLGQHPLRIGVNAFGFGGTNYHLLLEEFIPNGPTLKRAPPATQSIVCVAQGHMNVADFRREDFFKYDCPVKLPPKSAAGIDKVQLLAILTAWQGIKMLLPYWHWIPKEKISVISACSLGLDQVFEMAHRLVFEAVVQLAEHEKPQHPVTIKLRHHLETVLAPRYAPINEDAAAGVLNNVIAGRVCNAFDLHGKSYNLDKDIASVQAAYECIETELTTNPDQIFILIGVDEHVEKKGWRPVRRTVHAQFFTSESFAYEHELPIKGKLS